MKTYLCSDVHADFFVPEHLTGKKLWKAFETNLFQRYVEPADRIVIAGDVANGAEMQLEFLKFIATKYSEVYYVFGNHDLVVKEREKTFDTSEERMEFVVEVLTEHAPNVVVLDSMSEYGDIAGCMGFCDFDFSIKGTSYRDHLLNKWKAGEWFDPYFWNYMDMVPEHIWETYDERLTDICKKQPKVVVTHFCPREMGISPIYSNSITSGFFYFNANKYLDMLPDGTIWLCGHTHDCWDTEYVNESGNRIRIMCNPVAYPEENPYTLHSLSRKNYILDV